MGSIVALSLLFGLVLGTSGLLGAGTVPSHADDGTSNGFLPAVGPFEDGSTATAANGSGGASDSAVTTDVVTDEERPAFPRRIDSDWERLPHVEERDPGHVTVETSRSSVDAEHVERYLADAVNEYRSSNGLEPWSYSYALASTARGHSYDMYDRDFFAHENPDGEQAWNRWGREHCRARFGENLAETYLDHEATDAAGDARRYYTARDLANATVALWQDSTSHDDLLRATWPDAAGVGVYVDEYEGGGYVVYATLNVCAEAAGS